MWPARGPNGSGGRGGGMGAQGGSFYSPQQYYGQPMPPRGQQQPFGGFQNGPFAPGGGGGGGGRGGGFGQPGQSPGWGNNAQLNGPRYPRQQVDHFSGGQGYAGQRQQQQGRHASFNDQRGGAGNGHGSSNNGWNGFTGPSGSRSAESQGSRRRSPSPVLSKEESDIRDLVRAVDRDIIERNRKLSIIWSKAHSDALDNLLQAMDRAEEAGSKERAIDPLLEAFALMIECRIEGRLDPSQKGRTNELKEAVVNGIYDLCEDGSDAVRKLGYGAMRDLSRSDATLLKRNADVLVQLLQNEEPTEHDLISKSLVGHLKQSPVDAFDVIIQDHCKGELRHLALSFLASPQAEKVLDDKVVGNADYEAALALRLADIIPLCNDEEMELIKVLLRPLSTLWLPSFDFATTEEYENASASASLLLVRLVEGFLIRFRAAGRRGAGEREGDAGSGAAVLESQSKEIEAALASSELLSPASGSEMQDAHELFKSLLEVSTYEPASDGTAATPASAAYIKDVQKALRFVHKFLPDTKASSTAASAADTATSAATAPTLLRHLGGQLRILVLRFAAEVAAKAAVAINKAPTNADNLTEDDRRALARAAVAAINSIYPEEAKALPGPPGQQEAYEILLAEALLMILLHATPPGRNAGPITLPEIEEQPFKNRLRRLYGASQEVRSNWHGHESIKESAKGVFVIAKEYLKPRHNRLDVSAQPLWWKPPPAFPVDEARPKRGRDDDDEEHDDARPRPSRTDSSKRSRPSDVADSATQSRARSPSPPRPAPAPRGRGTTQAPMSSAGWESDDLFASSRRQERGGVRGFSSTDSKLAQKQGLSIRGGGGGKQGASIKGASQHPDSASSRQGMSIRGAASSTATAPAPEPAGQGRGLSILGAARERTGGGGGSGGGGGGGGGGRAINAAVNAAAAAAASTTRDTTRQHQQPHQQQQQPRSAGGSRSGGAPARAPIERRGSGAYRGRGRRA
ncbi:uncharacterized protein PFL1_05525 [Pseudozyma flocculosa PF-1]|uniref:Uncharacterized protein n=2 Tax=Pseudozyma flocculosa TaxID=84751 RepID=A0A5C3F9S8_9BASI|nr:uncharacterized protein PFL1_05525 [Pseudozyma flocculosa PF-1]EPQ26890.1 hypothetical protein PFL1_05525 [Pseudozyma flocculosa PF-1]SPO41203.1 uncharacterized protein PSFLO_06685 [Pseudozyma flocculosa]